VEIQQATTADLKGELKISKLRWIDIDFEHNTVRIAAEKNSNPRILKICNKLVGMLQVFPKINEKLFGTVSINTHRSCLEHTRKVLARKLNNPRLLEIHFHTLRHWKGTMLYHETKDILYVKEYLGHKKVENTLLYIQLANAIFNQDSGSYTSRVAKTVEEAQQLIEAGFEYVCDIDNVKLFRKRN